jgi:hypothetical protein
MSIDSLLNFSAELDVALLDQAVAAFYTGRAAPDVRVVLYLSQSFSFDIVII